MSSVEFWKELEGKVGGINLFDYDISGVSETLWNDAYFERKRDSYFPFRRICHNDSIMCAKSFLNWYISGEKPANLIDVWLGLVSSIKIGNSCCLYPGSIVSSLGSKTIKIPDSVTKIIDINYENHSKEVTDVRQWYNLIWSWLESVDPANVEINNNQKALNYLGFMAIMLMVIPGKERNVDNHMRECSSKFRKIWLTSVPNHTPSPHISALNFFKIKFARFTTDCDMALISLIESYLHPTQIEATNMLNAGCLLSLKEIGLGCFHWIKAAAMHKGVDILTMMKYIAFDRYKNINANLEDFLINYVDPEKNQKTWPWARMFCDGAFFKLRSAANPEYSAIMMAITIDGQPNHNMWEIPQFKNQRMKFDKVRVINMARAISKCIDENKEEIQQSSKT